MTNLGKCNINCNVIDYLSTKICVPGEIKETYVKVFNMITRINETKTLVKHISCDCKCKLNSTTCNWNQKRNDKFKCKCKKYHAY